MGRVRGSWDGRGGYYTTDKAYVSSTTMPMYTAVV